MCTIGVRRFGDDEYVLFKNKDFARNHFEDRLVVERGLFGVVGLSTWSQTDPRLDRYSGVSVGANDAGLLCCDANVRGAEDQSNYDELVEMALRSGGGVGEGVAAIRAAVSTRPYLWSNLILIDHHGAAAVEVRDRTIVVTALSGPTARSNHHLSVTAPDDPAVSNTSHGRLTAAQCRIGAAASTDDVSQLQRSHDDGDTGVCSHSGSQTVYSYILWRRGDTTRLLVNQGHPCDPIEHAELIIPIGSDWSVSEAQTFRTAYPSAAAGVVV